MMQTRKGENFGDLFRSCAEKTFGTAGLTPEEREKLYSLGDRLGYLGMDMQLKQLEMLERELEYSLGELQKELPEKRNSAEAWECFWESFWQFLQHDNRGGEFMEVSIIFKIAAVGILVSVLCQVLKHSGREEQAFLVSLAGLLMVLFWIVPYIYELFESIQQLFVL